MQERSHDALVTEQFGPQAQSYLTSAVHAQGEDLGQFAAIVGSRPEALALDLGCGGGHVSFLLAPLVRKVVAYDLSEAMVAMVRAEAARRALSNLDARQGSAERLPCPDATFDIVASRYSTHHWRDAAAGLHEARRVLKPGGLAVFMDVVTPGSPPVGYVAAIARIAARPLPCAQLFDRAMAGDAGIGGVAARPVLTISAAPGVLLLGQADEHAGDSRSGDPVAARARRYRGDAAFRDRRRRDLHDRHDADGRPRLRRRARLAVLGAIRYAASALTRLRPSALAR
jgi:SAM-dependent methyltransferase